MKSDTQHKLAKPLNCNRRLFLAAASGGALGAMIPAAASVGAAVEGPRSISPAGPASKYSPSLQVAFVRRKEEYGMWWPGAIYDGEAALKDYTQRIQLAAEQLSMRATIRPQPIFSNEEADRWIAEAKGQRTDGLLVVLLDRQQHAWPTATKAIDSGIPTVVFAPVGAAFTTNTWALVNKPGAFISSTDDFSQTAYGMKMIAAGAKLRETRFIVLKGSERADREVRHFGTKLRYVPAHTFLDDYNKTPDTDEIRQISDDFLRNATGISGPTERDVLNGVKSFVVARNILKREQGDAITMDCLGALAKSKVSLPCIAWAKMLDQGIPAACEADIGAAVTHALVQYLFDRPGFQQDPVPETARDCLIGAHCTCPTKLNGFTQPAEPYYLSHHHGKRDATPRPTWRVGQRVTVASVELAKQDQAAPRMIMSAGEVVENVSVPPAGGCVVSVMVKLDGVDDYLSYPGFHQIFFYGDFKKDLRAYCRLHGITEYVV